MNGKPAIALDAARLAAALARFPRERAHRAPQPRACALKPGKMTCASTLHLGRPLAEAGLPMTSGADADMVSSAGSTGLGRNAAKDYSGEKTFHIHNGSRTGWWAPHG